MERYEYATRITVTCVVRSSKRAQNKLHLSGRVFKYQYHALHHVVPHRMQQEDPIKNDAATHKYCIKSEGKDLSRARSVQHPSEVQRDQDCCSQDQGHKENPAGTHGIGSRPITRRRRRARMLLHFRSRERWFWNGSCKGIHSSLTSAHQVRPMIQERHSGLAVFRRPKWHAQVNKLERAAAN